MTSKTIEDFIADEDRALTAQEQGGFYPDHHHVIKPEFKKVFKKLDPEILQRYYFHSFRVKNFPCDVSPETWPAFLKAIEKLIELMQSQSYNTICGFTKFEALFLFGYDGHAVKNPDTPLTLTIYLERLEVYKKANQYTNIPGVLNKIEKLMVFGENENLRKHIHFTLRQSEFHYEQLTPYYFLFWVLVGILLLKPDAETKQTIELFKKANLPDMSKRLETLARFEVAIANTI